VTNEISATKELDGLVDDIRSIVADHGRLPIDVATIGDDEDLFDLGMTSTASVGVMFALQDRFDFEFPDSMLRRSTFESISAIRAAVNEILAMPQAE
jgi:acyl carrier protein